MVLLLLEQIVELFFCMILGWFLVRLRLLKPADSHVLSVVCMDIVIPCVIVTAYQVDATPELLQGLMLSLGAAIGIHILFFIVTALLRRPLRLTPVEEASIVYTNCGNLIVPLVSAVLGPEWIIYSSVFQLVQQFPLWSHGRVLLSGEQTVSLKRILLNVNILSVFAGVLLFLLRIQLPVVIRGTMDSVGAMMGPISMLVAGMLLGGQDLRAIVRKPCVWRVALLRLLVIPLLVLCAMKTLGLARLAPGGESILLISLLAACAPPASTVTQIAQVYGTGGDDASAINAVTTLLCIGTMPLMVSLYQL